VRVTVVKSEFPSILIPAAPVTLPEMVTSVKFPFEERLTLFTVPATVTVSKSLLDDKVTSGPATSAVVALGSKIPVTLSN